MLCAGVLLPIRTRTSPGQFEFPNQGKAAKQCFPFHLASFLLLLLKCFMCLDLAPCCYFLAKYRFPVLQLEKPDPPGKTFALPISVLAPSLICVTTSAQSHILFRSHTYSVYNTTTFTSFPLSQPT